MLQLFWFFFNSLRILESKEARINISSILEQQKVHLCQTFHSLPLHWIDNIIMVFFLSSTALIAILLN